MLSSPRAFPAPAATPGVVDPERRARYWRGIVAEWLASVLLMLRGYSILARRFRSPFGEIDIVARRGKRLAFVEVKRRPLGRYIVSR